MCALAVLASTQGLKTDRWVPDEEWLKEGLSRLTPPKGYVTKRATAIAIGRAAIVDRYDERLLRELEPLDAKRLGDTWVVYSYFPLRDKQGLPTLGGVTTVEISAKSGAILNIERGM